MILDKRWAERSTKDGALTENHHSGTTTGRTDRVNRTQEKQVALIRTGTTPGAMMHWPGETQQEDAMRTIIEARHGVHLVEEILTDGSKVYDVTLYGSDNLPGVSFHLGSDVEAMEFFRKISCVSFTVYTG